MPTFHAYIRVSTLEQGDNYSIPTQREKAKDIKNKHYPAFTYNEAVDTESGTNERENLTRLLLNLGENDVFWVYDSSRLARNTGIASNAKYQIINKKAEYWEGDRKQDLSNPTDALLFNILSSVGEFDSDLKRVKVKDSMDQQKSRGEAKFGPLLGYNNIGGEIQINPAEASQIQRIFELYLAVGSINKVAKILNGEGYKGKNTAKRLTATGVTSIIKNPIFMGYQYKGTPSEMKKAGVTITNNDLIQHKLYEPIVTPEIWWEAYRLYPTNASRHREPKSLRFSKFPYSSLFSCYHCEQRGKVTLYWRNQHFEDGKTWRYRYQSKEHLPKCGALLHSIPEERLEWIMEISLRLSLRRHAVISRYVQKLLSAREPDTKLSLILSEEIGTLNGEIQRQTSKLLLIDAQSAILAINENLKLLENKKAGLEKKRADSNRKVEETRFKILEETALYRQDLLGRIFRPNGKADRKVVSSIVKKAQVFKRSLVLQYNHDLSHIIICPANRGPSVTNYYYMTEYVPSMDVRKYILQWDTKTVLECSSEKDDLYKDSQREGNVQSPDMVFEGQNCFRIEVPALSTNKKKPTNDADFKQGITT